MGQSQRITIEIRRAPETKDRWTIPIANWPGFHVAQISDISGNVIAAFTQEDGVIVCRPDAETARLFATVDLDQPPKDIEAANLEFERAKAASDDQWRMRTYAFSVGSAVLAAIVTIGVALITRPSHATASINIDSVHACRDSLQRLSTLAQLKGQTLEGLATAVGNHSATCDPTLEGLIETVAKGDSK
jgi:hypothetical protein